MKAVFKIGKIVAGIVFASGLISMILDFWNQAQWYSHVKSFLWYMVVTGLAVTLLCAVAVLVLFIIGKLKK